MRSDWQLIQACKRGDGAAWQTVIDRYERLLFAIARRYGLTQSDAADVVQTTFIDMLKQLDQFHAESNLKGWLGTVGRRNAWRVLNRYDHEQVQSPPDLREMMAALGATTDGMSDDFAVIDWLHDGLETLGGRCQQLVTLLYFDEASYDDIAAALAMAKGSIGATRSRCLHKLRTILEELA